MMIVMVFLNGEFYISSIKKGGFMKWPHTKVTAMYDNGFGHSMPACRNAIKACRHVALNK